MVRKLSYHRFIVLEEEDMISPDDKSEAYTIIEFYMMQGRSEAVRKNLIKTLFERIKTTMNIDTNDIEICIIESPACNWGFRGECGDDIRLNYKVNV